MGQLYSLTGLGFSLPYASEPGTRRVLVTAANNIPCVRWPNGHWCLPANLYLLDLYDQGLSRQGIGGTLATYASNIGHLVRFCFDHSVEFHELVDSQFARFIRELRTEKGAAGDRKRSDNHVLAIANNCLDFLEFVALDRQDETLIGRHGRVKAYRRVERARNSKYATRKWIHSSLPTPDPKRRSHPIASGDVEALRAAVLPASRGLRQRRRRYVMLKCLEITGGRRIEITRLQVADVVQAIESPHHQLRLMTAKRRGGKEDYRTVPCTLNDLREVWDFIRTTRRAVIKATIGLERDHGYVFVNERTGQMLRPNTITQEVFALARFAGLAARATPHMFRHRFITKIFVALIQQYDLHNPSDLRRAVIGIKEIKQQLMEWTGHRSMQSLDRYIDLAFAEVEQLRIPMESLNAGAELSALRDSIGVYADVLSAEGLGEAATRLYELIGSPRAKC